MLRWEDKGYDLEPLARNLHYFIRLMNYDDLDAVHALDFAAFEPVWQHSRDLLEIAFNDAAIATVVEDDHGILGYQVSTVNASDGHLARLAVHPRGQGSGVGYSLIQDLLSNFRRRGVPRVTVNTQTNNKASLALYQKVGFHKTGMMYPIFRVS